MEKNYFEELKRRKILLDERGAEYLSKFNYTLEEGKLSPEDKDSVADDIKGMLADVLISEDNLTSLVKYAVELKGSAFLAPPEPKIVKYHLGFSQIACDAKLVNLREHLMSEEEELILPVFSDIKLSILRKKEGAVGCVTVMVGTPSCYDKLEFGKEMHRGR